MKVRRTVRDANLAHQISLRFKHSHNSITQVMCNCRADPLGEVSNADDPWPIYNNPDNHNQMREPFVPGQSTAREMDVE